MFPEPTESLFIGYSIESISTPKIQIKYIDTKNQLSDILTKGNVTRDEWNHLLCLFNISHFSSTNCSEVMSKRTQKDSGEERVTAKSKPMMNLFPAMQRKESWRACLNCITKPGRKQDMKVNYLWAHEQHQRTGRPVEDAYSSSYSEWNADENWSSQ